MPRTLLFFTQSSPSGLKGGFRFIAFSVKDSRAYLVSAEFSPKQKPSGVSHRANQRSYILHLRFFFLLESIRVSLRTWHYATPDRLYRLLLSF